MADSNSNHQNKKAAVTAVTTATAATATSAATTVTAASAATTAGTAAATALVQTYTQLVWDLRLLQWRNYFEEGGYDLSLRDNQFYLLAKHFLNRIKPAPADRQSEIIQMLITRDLVDKNPAAAKLCNLLDNPDNYRASDLIPMALGMKPDVLDLMYIRNGLSKDQGFHSYPDLVLATEEIDRNRLINLLHEYLAANLPKAQRLINKYDIRWESWFSDLGRISPLIATAAAFEPIAAIDRFLELLGLTEAKDKIKIDFQEHGLAGMASEVAPGDIRIMVAPVDSIFDFKVLFHELGHALAYCLNQEQELYRILPASYDEAMAIVIEHLAPKLLLDSAAQEKATEIDILEHTRCAISALFEFDLWENPKQADTLYLKHYGRLGVRIDHPELWALDSFRSIDPVYIHNYVIGATLAPRLYDFLLQNYGGDYQAWGQWLIDNIYIDGRKRPFPAKVTGLCAL